jgi:hypothetical protein
MATDLQTSPEPTVTATVSGIVNDFQELVKQQLALFKAEVTADLHKTREGGIFLACGAGSLFVGGALLCFAVVYLLAWAAPTLPLWACYLIIGGTLAVVGAGLTLGALYQLRSVTTKQSVQSLEENLEWKTKPN